MEDFKGSQDSRAGKFEKAMKYLEILEKLDWEKYLEAVVDLIGIIAFYGREERI